MGRYNIGDKVIINENLSFDATGIEGIENYLGKEAIILAIKEYQGDDDYTDYYLDVCDPKYVWNQNWFAAITS